MIEKKYKISIGITLLLYSVGIVGLLSPYKSLFQQATPITLLVSAFLLAWNHEERTSSFYLFACIAFVVGYGVEYVGVNHHLIFGNYHYGSTLGFKLWNIPLMIGINWFITMYSIGTILTGRVSATHFVFVCAMTAVILDWLMEPVAIHYDFWSWQGGQVPLSNYIGWFVVSAILFTLFSRLKVAKPNRFALPFLIMESVFFLVLNVASRF
jgi:bisanhydrobacterioruberin hydratase